MPITNQTIDSNSKDAVLCDPVPVYDLMKLDDERAKTLHSLLVKSHHELAPLRDPYLLFHSHMPHMLRSAFLLGFPGKELEDMFHSEAKTLKRTDDGFIRSGITRENWREFLNRKEYTVVYTLFFDHELEGFNGQWEKLLHEYLFSSSEPLINGFLGGLGHPLIHLAYAYEFNSPEIATEALSLGCTERDYIHRFLDNIPPDNATFKSTSTKDILLRVRNDDRFSGLFEVPGFRNIQKIFENREETILEYWNSWELRNPTRQLEDILDVSLTLFMNSANEAHEYDFFIAHALTAGHAIRVLLPRFPVAQHIPLLKQFWFFILYVYIAQLRPDILPADFLSVNIEKHDWEWVSTQARMGSFCNDSHRVKVLRALKNMEETWGRKEGRYLKAAVKFVTDFNGWTGFGNGVDG